MTTQIGNLSYTIGNKYDIYCSDMSVSQLKNFSYNLPNNSIIVSSPTTSGVDIGKPSILMTDHKGSPLPLTYSFDPKYFIYNETSNTVTLNMSYIKNELYSYFQNIFIKR